MSAENARHLSVDFEHYTPPEVVAAARVALGEIELDPASCETANQTVQAERFYGLADDGYAQRWAGRVLLNPPGGWCDRDGRRVIKASKGAGPCSETGACGLPPGHQHQGTDSSQKRWWQKLAVAWKAGEVDAAVFVCFSVELLQTTQVEPKGPLPLAFPICYPSRRLAYVRADGSVGASPPHSSCLVLLPAGDDDVQRFIEAFAPIGYVTSACSARRAAPPGYFRCPRRIC